MINLFCFASAKIVSTKDICSVEKLLSSKKVDISFFVFKEVIDPLSFVEVKDKIASLFIFFPFALTSERLQYKIIFNKPSFISPLLGSKAFVLCFPSIKLTLFWESKISHFSSGKVEDKHSNFQSKN